MTQIQKPLGFIHIPKTGGKSLIEFFHQNNIPYIYNLHKTISELWNVGNQDYYNITIVRHPYDRVLSFYNFFTKLENSPFSNLSFDEFISNIESISPLIKPCYDFCTIDSKIQIDYIIKLENLFEDVGGLCNLLSIQFPDKFPMVNTNENYSVRKLSSNHKNKIVKVFEKDFKTFSYEP